jgi:hypothetical protein
MTTHVPYVLLVTAVLALSCSSRGNDQARDRLVEYGTRLADISRALGELDSDLSELETSVDEVRSAIDDFDGRSWAGSLENIDQAAVEVESDLDEVRSALDEIASKVRGFTSGSSSAKSAGPEALSRARLVTASRLPRSNNRKVSHRTVAAPARDRGCRNRQIQPGSWWRVGWNRKVDCHAT